MNSFPASILRTAAAAWLALISLTHAVAKPNIILIMADDFGYECVTANGGESYKTPVLDKLAAGGVRFEQCHVQPLCTPTRVQLMTGKYNVRNYLNFGTLVESERTFANVLKDAGYATGICGKWQLGRGKELPQHFGFDESCLWQHTRRPPRYANPGLEYNGVEKDFSNGEYGPKLVNDFALEFITKHKEKPFFLYYPMMLAHDPFQPTPDSADWDPTTTGEQAKKSVKHFADMTAYMDKMVGQVLTKLEELGLRENTLVLFLGDNGTGKGVNSQFKGADYPGGKGSTNARGTHVPFIASWPAVMKEARINMDLVSSTDFLPTLCEAAGIAVPEGVDGVSFLPQLRGEKGAPRESLYMWYSPRQGNDMMVRECAFDQQYKLYKNGDFYSLAQDIDEKKPVKVSTLEGEPAAAAAKLQKVLDHYEGARPEALDKAFAEGGASNPRNPNAKGKGKNKGQGKGKKSEGPAAPDIDS